MNESRIERVDSIPLIFHCLRRMKVSERIDLIWRPHSNWEGLSYGELAVLFLMYVLYMRTHRLCSMEEWVERHRTTLEAVTGWPIGPKECTDDRLGRLLEVLGRNDDIMYLFQRDLGKQLIQAYSLPTAVARFDTSTFSVHHSAEKEGEGADLMQFGHSKDRRPDLRQFKQGLGSLDPAGIPLVTQIVSGETADDGLYLPAWREMRQTIGHPDFLFVADCKAAALATRAAIAQAGGVYLFPLPMTGTVPDLLRTWVLDPPAPPEAICLDKLGVGDQKKGVVGQGFVVEREMEIAWEEEDYTWTERWLVTQSQAQAHRQQQALERRLSQAEQALAKLTPKKKESIQEVHSRVNAILTKYKVEGLIQVELTETTTQRKQFIGRGRPGPDRPFQIVTDHQIHLSYHRLEAAMEEQRQLAGWRLHVTNTAEERLSLPQAIAYYRDEWLLERGFHRFKKGTLPAVPLWVRLPERIKGLMLLLMVALQALTLIEFVVARELADRGERLAGLVPGNPNMKTARPSAERILALFSHIHLLMEETEHYTTGRRLETLSPVQQKILHLLDIPESVYDLTLFRAREKIKIPA